ncbi:MAG TPA: hypothetical protein VK738_08940 [Terriglobales bacterium]|jgi:hypothetical protein|nr:hypothetical protein [Terriglobales bacterium]
MPGSREKMNNNGNNGGNGNNGKAQQPLNFANKLIASIPHGRKGKHSLIVAKILADLDRLDLETAILVPLDGLNGEKMENVRSALNRATKQKKLSVATSTDNKYFYVWRTDAKGSQVATAPGKLASQIHHQR